MLRKVNSYFWKIPRPKFVPLLAHNFLSDSGTNLALNQATQQSSDYGEGGQSSRAVDGDTNGSWYQESVTHTSGSDKNNWWKVTLAKRSFVYHIEVGTAPLKNKQEYGICASKVCALKPVGYPVRYSGQIWGLTFHIFQVQGAVNPSNVPKNFWN